MVVLWIVAGGAVLFAQGSKGSLPSSVQTRPIARPSSSFDGSKGIFVPEWKSSVPVSLKSDRKQMVSAPWFKGASLDADVVNLPYFDLVVEVGPSEGLTLLQSNAENMSEESSADFRSSISESGLKISDSWYPSSPVVLGETEQRSGKYFQHVKIYPIRVSSNGDRVEKAELVRYQLGRQRVSRLSGGQRSTARNYASSSVLASGDWFKLGIVGDGIYRLDYAYFQQLGIDPGTINPNSIRIHGNGGSMLPQTAGEFPHDDLVENAIFVSGSGDGQFNPGDFVLFYAEGPHKTQYSARMGRFVHQLNAYSDTSFYFLTWGGGNGRRITTQSSLSTSTFTPTDTRRFAWHEIDRFNPLNSGRSWLGETFDLTTRQNFDFSAPGILPSTQVLVSTRLAARSNYASSFTLREGNTAFGNITAPNTYTANYDAFYYRIKSTTTNIPSSQISDGVVNLVLEYQKPDASSIGYLDYIEVEYRSSLNMGGSPIFYFHAVDNAGLGQIFGYQIQGANSGTRVWDITDPVNVVEQGGNLSGSTFNFNVACPGVKRFMAFHGGYLSPASAKRIGNQNLHALDQAEYIMVVPSEFVSAAQTLADFHRNQFARSVHVVKLHEIFNEFSSGRQDPTAIRDFVKMFYDRGLSNGTEPQYLLLMGDGSYDYRGRAVSSGGNFIPTYQCRKSSHNTESYTSDDYFGFLDDGEGFWGEKAATEVSETDFLYLAEGDTVVTTHALDIAVGRLPVSSAAQANQIVQKIIQYKQSDAGLGPWRNKVVLVADHKDADSYIHVSQADSYSPDIEAANACINIDKIYMDNYTMENTASGARFPDGKEALLKALDEGSLLVNYTGHGGEIAWSNASILDIADISSMRNGSRLPAYITATCEFGRWDDPARVSGAESLFLKEDGGAIAMFTTVRVVYSGPNYILNSNFYKYVLTRDTVENRMPTIGEVFMKTKNDSWLGGINNRNFSLMGDPALTLEYPEYQAVITTLNGQAVDAIVDTLNALSLVTVEGEIRDASGQLIPNFNGDLYASVYDKPSQFTTKRAPFTFMWQKNKIFVGEASVTNGRFNFQFVVPIDISYENGNGKISLYARNTQTDAAGCNRAIRVGGSGQGGIVDDKGPELQLFMNDEQFVDGGMVNPDAVLLADVFDDNGLNTVGTGIGHELTAILDNNERDVIILNDFYSAARNSYQNGRITYPFKDLAPGEHHLKVKVWDVANNSSSGELTFVVADDAVMALGHVLNYPNPFSTRTEFFIEHNRNGSLLDIQIRVYTTAGRVVKTLRQDVFAEGNLFKGLEWDGLDDYGDAIGRGVYVYQVIIKDKTRGGSAHKFEKLVLLR
jgi:hypothetical protein